MNKNKFFTFILILAISFTTIFSFSVSYAADDELKGGAFEMTICELCLGVGDSIMEYLTFLLKEEVTIERIIFNEIDALNANFFDKSPNTSKAPATKFIKDSVNTWYAFLSKVVIIIYLAALVAVGVKILLGGADRKVNAREIFVKWTMGVVIFYFFPYVMRYAFDINEGVIQTIKGIYNKGSSEMSGSYLGVVSDLRYDELEERSPEYVTGTSYYLKLGSEEATAAYTNRLETYKTKGDVMRIMRSLAGIYARIIYVIIWFIMMGQLLVFIFIYFKRYLMIAFLIAIFPITLIEYVIGTITTGKQSSLGSWSREFFTNVFLQTIHAIIYGIISGVIIEQVRTSISVGHLTRINWFLMICAISFVFSGERILKEIMNAGHAESVKGASDVYSGGKGAIKGAYGKAKGATASIGKFADKFGKD